ncbi:DUF2835 family protein [Pleionea sediminis]|uniref:DUF2835 family protein n=1 Tax=Pleionea sediminis TaxID=2569479 RepID=UPI0011866CB2|nr:DUF2835 family protein [Pleionea sediminis]
MPSYTFHLAIAKDEWLRVYSDYSRYVWCRAVDGTRLKIPVKHFLPYVTAMGVSGSFVLDIDESNKFLSMKKISD